MYIINISPLPSGKHCLSVYEVDLHSVYCFHYCVEAFSFASVCCALGSYCRNDGQQQDLEIVPLWFRTSLLAFRSLKHWKHFIEGEKQGFSYFLFFFEIDITMQLRQYLNHEAFKIGFIYSPSFWCFFPRPSLSVSPCPFKQLYSYFVSRIAYTNDKWFFACNSLI